MRPPAHERGPVVGGRRRPRVGVFICHCGGNVSDAGDVDRVARETASLPGLICSTAHTFCCSDPGQVIIEQTIREQGLRFPGRREEPFFPSARAGKLELSAPKSRRTSTHAAALPPCRWHDPHSISTLRRVIAGFLISSRPSSHRKQSR
jgi:hypothetical protein